MNRFEHSAGRNDKEGDAGKPSRRKLLVGAGALGASMIAGSAVEAAQKLDSLNTFDRLGEKDDYDLDDFVQRANEYLGAAYGIRLRGFPRKGEREFLGQRPTIERYRRGIKILADELERYQCPEMIRAVGEGRGFDVYFLENPIEERHEEHDIPGKTYVRVGGVAPHLKDGSPAQMVISLSEEEENIRSNIHHELNHRLSQRFENQKSRDENWAGFHKYLSATPYHPRSGQVLEHDKPSVRCFLTAHAEEYPEEDEATSAAWMMMPQKIIEFLERWQQEKDPVIKDILGVKWLKTKMNYAQWSNGKIGDPFWEAMIVEGRKQQKMREAAR